MNKLFIIPIIITMLILLQAAYKLGQISVDVNPKTPETKKEQLPEVINIVESDKQLRKETNNPTPKFFTEFKLTLHIQSDTPKHAEYVLEQCDKLCKLIKTIPSVKEVDIIGVHGGDNSLGETDYYRIDE